MTIQACIKQDSEGAMRVLFDPFIELGRYSVRCYAEEEDVSVPVKSITIRDVQTQQEKKILLNLASAKFWFGLREEKIALFSDLLPSDFKQFLTRVDLFSRHLISAVHLVVHQCKCPKEQFIQESQVNTFAGTLAQISFESSPLSTFYVPRKDDKGLIVGPINALGERLKGSVESFGLFLSIRKQMPFACGSVRKWKYIVHTNKFAVARLLAKGVSFFKDPAELDYEISVLTTVQSIPGIVPFRLLTKCVREKSLYVLRLYQEIYDRNCLSKPFQVSIQTGKKWMKRLLFAAMKIESQGIVHNDLRAANILFDTEGPLITDFSLAYWAKDKKFVNWLVAPPEYWKEGVVILNKFDVWGLGLLFRRIAVGNFLPFEEIIETDDEKRRQEVKGHIEKLARGWLFFPPETPKEIQTLISSMLELDYRKRFTLEQAYQYSEKCFQ